MTKPSIPQGTRDFGPETVRKRQYILDTIKNVFNLYGFQPLETPAMENLETLMGKYGEEGDKLIFKILNNGLNDPRKTETVTAAFQNVLQGKNDKNLTERALKYDLTIPFARYVAMNHGQLSFPFKRFQMQPVWRADKPQQSRYREFWQCDADVVGSHSLLNEVELANIYRDVFDALRIPVEIRINSRNILSALAELTGSPERMTDITVAIDKLDKIGAEKVREELLQKGLQPSQVDIIAAYLAISGSNEQKMQQLQNMTGDNQAGRKGLQEIQYLLDRFEGGGAELVADFTLARGLNYYTGIIFEVKAKDVQIGSIGGGGRYDDLTGLFGVPNIPGVGISFGVDRIYDVMEKLQLFPDEVQGGTKILFFNLGEDESRRAYKLVQQLRRKGVPAELFHETAKMDKQFKYAERKKIPFIAILGSREMEQGNLVIKNLATGEQQTVAQENLSSFFS
jgi:histidyl-tRNA synthetase